MVGSTLRRNIKQLTRRASGSPLVQVLGDKQVEEAELQLASVVLLLQQPGQLVGHPPGHPVLAAHPSQRERET